MNKQLYVKAIDQWKKKQSCAETNFLAQLQYEKEEHETLEERRQRELTWIFTGKGHI